MKRLLLSFVLIASALSASAFGYDRAREQALFLSDKMAYELNLTQSQFDLAYQINLDYFLSVSSSHDIYGIYWQYRNADFRYILYDWQYSLYCALDYFYQPLRWVRSSWYFPVYNHYSRTHFYFGRPGGYGSYRGGWRSRGARSVSPYASHRPHSGRGLRDSHYPGSGRPGNGHVGGGNHGRGHDHGNVGGSNNGRGRDNGNVGGSNNGRGQHQVGSASGNQSRGRSQSSGRVSGRSYGR